MSSVVLQGTGGGGKAVVSGRVSRSHSTFRPGDVLVAEMTDPALFGDMVRASAVVTDQGGMMCHAAVICNEIGVPFVVGTKFATRDLTEGLMVTVNPVDGSVVVNGK